MILRKPYAFFIKYFKLLNLIMSVLMGILVYKTSILTKFLFDYVRDYAIVDSSFNISNYINFYNFLLPLLILIILIIIMAVLIVKDKPKKLYIANIIIYVLVLILYFIDYSVIQTTVDAILDVRVSKALRDITLIVLIAQIISTLLTLIRALGFDIKSFDFTSDIQKLDIDEKDSEEFEVAVEYDKNKTKRQINNKLRMLKYFYLENKFIVRICLIILSILIVFIVFINRNIYNANYSEGKTFNASSISMKVTDSYITNTDKDGNIIDNNMYLVVVKFDVRKFTDKKKLLNTGLITLKIGNKNYGQTTGYNNYLEDLGTSYIDQELNLDFTSYILVFAISKDKIDKPMYFRINDNVSYVKGQLGAKNIYIKLNPNDLTKKGETVESSLQNDLSFSGSFLGDTNINITQVNVGNKFKVEYDFCINKSSCTKSYEYITPTATGNYFKTLLRIDGAYEEDENANLEDLDNLYYFINKFGYIYYQIDGTWKNHKIDSQLVKPSIGKEDNITYIEVNKELEKSTNYYLLFKVRNNTYKYTIK